MLLVFLVGIGATCGGDGPTWAPNDATGSWMLVSSISAEQEMIAPKWDGELHVVEGRYPGHSPLFRHFLSSFQASSDLASPKAFAFSLKRKTWAIGAPLVWIAMIPGSPHHPCLEKKAAVGGELGAATPLPIAVDCLSLPGAVELATLELGKPKRGDLSVET
jgi:hypothetical protein